ncbi:MAG: hypothetical protein IKC10_00815 [Alphaproteobacteria bacterium]|nr:hypothetical protein [Alphaproteobacteria bacterium]
MKKTALLFLIILLSGCTNGLRCTFMHPDEMSPALFELCKARAKGTKINID